MQAAWEPSADKKTGVDGNSGMLTARGRLNEAIFLWQLRWVAIELCGEPSGHLIPEKQTGQCGFQSESDMSVVPFSNPNLK